MLDTTYHEMAINGIHESNNFNTESFQYYKDLTKSEVSSHLLNVWNYRIHKKVFNKV